YLVLDSLPTRRSSDLICEELGKEKLEAGKTSAYDFVESRPIISEIEAVRRVLSFAEATGCKLHIVHASSRKVIEVIQEAKDRGRSEEHTSESSHVSNS